MKRTKLEIRAEAVLLLALIYFFDTEGMIAAALPAAAAHELGHLLALRLCGRPIRRVCLSMAGLELDYAGALEGREALLCLSSGPLLGLLYALAAARLGGRYWTMSGGIGLALTVFNLLPVLPLDGGRILAELVGEPAARWVSRVAAASIALAAAMGRRWTLLAMALWLTARNFRPCHL